MKYLSDEWLYANIWTIIFGMTVVSLIGGSFYQIFFLEGRFLDGLKALAFYSSLIGAVVYRRQIASWLLKQIGTLDPYGVFGWMIRFLRKLAR